MTLKHDAAGFLVGQPITDGGDVQTLRAIKSDTGKILAAIQRAGGYSRSAQRQAVAPSGRQGAGPASRQVSGYRQASDPVSRGSRAAAMPAGRASSALMPARDARGRFMSVDPIASAADKLARTAEQQRRDARTSQQLDRGRDGRFKGRGEASGGGGHLGGIGGSIVGNAGAMVEGADRVDPAIAALNEMRGMASAARSVVAPLGRLWGSPGRNSDTSGWLQRQWRELREGRREAARSDKTMLATLKDIAARTGAGAGQDGGGIGIPSSLIPAGVSGVAATAGAALKGVVKRIPVVGALVEAITGVIEDQRIASDATLTAEQRQQKRSENAGGVAGALSGAAAGAALGSAILPGIGTVIGAIGGGIGGSKIGGAIGGSKVVQDAIGWISRRFESGGAGAGAVSSGRGDAGGASYGSYQLSSSTGTLGKFLASSGYGAQFEGLQPGTREFGAKWKALASDPAFGQAQHDFIGRTHFDPQMAKLQAAGIDLSGRGDAVKEAVWSTATQFGANSSLITKALAGKNPSAMSDADIVSAIQDYKIANNATLFRSSPALQAGTLSRAQTEKNALLTLAATPADPVVAAAAMRMPSLPTVASPPPVSATPTVDPAPPIRLNARPPVVVAQAPAADPSQDVSDRTIAHIVSGGIGGGMAYR